MNALVTGATGFIGSHPGSKRDLRPRETTEVNVMGALNITRAADQPSVPLRRLEGRD